MLVNLIYHEENILSSHLNVFPWSLQESDEPNVKIGNLLNLGMLVDDNEASEIIANRILSFLSPKEVHVALREYVKKLRHGGKIIIIDLDLYLICKDIMSFKITSEEGNKLLYGDQQQEYLIKRVALNGLGVANHLEQMGAGLEIEEKSYNGYEYIVTARRK